MKSGKLEGLMKVGCAITYHQTVASVDNVKSGLRHIVKLVRTR